MQSKKSSPLKTGIGAFTLTFILLIGLLTAQFIYKYKDDLFEKHLDTIILVKMFSMTLVSLSSLVLPISILVFSAVFYRKLFKDGETDIRLQIRKAILPILACCVVCFLWTSFLIPNATLHQMRLLYDIRMKAPNDPLTRTDISIFKRSKIGSNFFELREHNDSSELNISKIKRETVNSILTIADSAEINELLQDSSAKELGFTTADFKNEVIKNGGYVKDTANMSNGYLQYYWQAGKMRIENEKGSILKNSIEISKMVAYPFLILISFFIGMFIGVLNRHQKYLLLLLAGIYFTIFPGIYYLMIYFEKLAKEEKLSPFQGQVSFLLILTSIAFLLYKYAMTHVRAEQQGRR